MRLLGRPVAALVAVLLLGLAGPTLTSAPAEAAPPAAERAAADRKQAWAKSFAKLEDQLSGPAGVSVVAVGSRTSLTVGSWRTGVAWSTSKVPLSVAALRRSDSAKTKARVRKAITKSDNAAAEKLWRGLGSPKKAGRRVQAVIRDAGDDDTVVQYRRVRPPYTAFGQTRWALDDQARFSAGLRCRPSSKPVRKLMGHITPSQRWGLGKVDGAKFKGGWGPVGNGYLVRQMGTIRLDDGRTYGVAIAVHSADGFAQGTKDLNRVARWLAKRVDQIPGGRC